MTDKDIKMAIKHCVWLSDNHYSVIGKKLHKGICSAMGSVCGKTIDEGKCPVLIKLFKEEKKMNDEEICGKCLYHKKEEDWWVCTNPSSECYGCCTEYNGGSECEDFEERQNIFTKNFSVEIL